MKEVYLKEIAKINIGISITRAKERKYENGIKSKFISPKSISNNYIKHEEIEELEVRSTVYKTANKTKIGDILIKTTSPFDTVLIEKEDIGLMYNSFCINVTIVNKEFDKKYIFAYLNTEFIQNKLENKAKSYKTTPISKKDIEEIKIPYIEKEKQQKIGEMYLNILEREKKYKELIKNEKQIIEAIIFKDIILGERKWIEI